MSIHETIDAARKAALPEAEELKKFREYARGRHKSTLTAGQGRILRGLLGNLFCDNVCKRILQELRNRLRLARFEVSGTGNGAEAIEAYLESLWVLNKVASLSAAVHWATLRDGNHAVALAWVKDRVVLTRERWWNGKTGIFVAYDSAGQPEYAVKDWNESGKKRRTVWYPNRIERYIMEGEGWKNYSLPDDPFLPDGVTRLWPIPWTVNGEKDGDPIGIPIVHFANIQVPNDGPGNDDKQEPDPLYGMSELDGGILGLQDEINDLHRDLTAAARFAGYQMLWGTGITAEYDENQNRKNQYHVEPGAFFEEPNPNAKFGSIPPGSMEELQRALTIKHQATSRMSSVPLHLISGEWPSGEALLRAEMPLIDKVETIGSATGPAWASVMHKATRLQNVYGRATLNEDLLITTVFASAARRDPLTLAMVAEKYKPFVSEAEILRILGYSPKDVERIQKEKEAEFPRLDPATFWEVAVAMKAAGASFEEILRKAGYTPAQIAKIKAEKEVEVEELGDSILKTFDAGGDTPVAAD
jgi:hypothetical protein